MDLRYGLNPQQQPASASPVVPGRWPVRVVHGEPSYINMLDALNSWQLVREARTALDAPIATSFKHVSPAGAAAAGTVDGVMADLYGVDPTSIGALTSAYVRARDSDPKCSYGDFIAVSHEVDAELADLLSRVVSDGIIAPGFADGTVATLSRKKRGRFLIMSADPTFTPPEIETRDVYGLRLTQPRDPIPLPTITTAPPAAARDLVLGLAVLRFTQSNSVGYVRDGMTLGIGAGQQSRVDCTRLAGAKVDTWWLRRHPAVRALTFPTGMSVQDRVHRQLQFVADLGTPPEWLAGLGGVSFVSDGALPFRDNVDEAHRHGAAYIAEPGGSIRSADVSDACVEHGITLVRTDLRLFHH
jgi:AICAR transformylase/IMP cyclohydrolase PurH